MSEGETGEGEVSSLGHDPKDLETEVEEGFRKEAKKFKVPPRKRRAYVEKHFNDHFDAADRIVEARTKGEATGEIDPLTQLPNRAAFAKVLDRAYAAAARWPDQTEAYLLMLDLDNFKVVNDTYGHSKGDDVLKATSEVLKNLRPTDFAARYGGEELVVLMVNPTPTSKDPAPRTSPMDLANRLILNIQSTVAKRTGLKGQGVSIGISPLRDPLTHEIIPQAQLIQNADIALYQSKARGKKQATVFEKDMPMPPPTARKT